MQPLTEAEITEHVAARSGWSVVGSGIERTFERPSFADAIAFVVRVGFFAEAADHHPDLDLRWRTVRVFLTTHEAGGLTGRDFDLAAAIDSIGHTA